MNRFLNRVELIGRLGADPERFTSESGLTLCILWFVTEDFWKDQTGNVYQAVEWHRVIAWDRLAEDCDNFLAAGDLAFGEGHLTTRIWQDEKGNSHFITELVADRVSLLERPSDRQHDKSNFILETNIRASEPYQPPIQPDLTTQRKLLFGISNA